MSTTASVGRRVWLPNVDYLIGPESYTKAHCMYCFHETEWCAHLRALGQMIEHLDREHQERRHPALPRTA